MRDASVSSESFLSQVRGVSVTGQGPSVSGDKTLSQVRGPLSQVRGACVAG